MIRKTRTSVTLRLSSWINYPMRRLFFGLSDKCLGVVLSTFLGRQSKFKESPYLIKFLERADLFPKQLRMFLPIIPSSIILLAPLLPSSDDWNDIMRDLIRFRLHYTIRPVSRQPRSCASTACQHLNPRSASIAGSRVRESENLSCGSSIVGVSWSPSVLLGALYTKSTLTYMVENQRMFPVLAKNPFFRAWTQDVIRTFLEGCTLRMWIRNWFRRHIVCMRHVRMFERCRCYARRCISSGCCLIRKAEGWRSKRLIKDGDPAQLVLGWRVHTWCRTCDSSGEAR
ncbi:hypothetical protein BDP27DRAFT_110980 [Rhodocollybia butyracea]|uniref:Uncharacterized protein n=1 Tax=Rhodocollybia butyracea TaxID=206335 RepID=A0A9P5PFW3_9AGAR|nr:hypothetical protein BDP27DRAFT_110980 [Rhodocollybia butyracea]